MAQQKIACMEGFHLKARAVTWNEQPMANFIAQQADRTDRREFATESWVSGVGAFRKNEPNAIVPGRFVVISQHANNPVAQVDGETGEHPTHLRVQGRKRFEHKCVRGLLL